MPDDVDFYELATKFPAAILALLGERPPVAYRGEAIEVKVASGRFDAVLTPVEPGRAPDTALIYVELHGWAQEDFELRLLQKMLAHRIQSGHRGPVRGVIFYENRRIRDACAGSADLGNGAERLNTLTPRRVVLDELPPAVLDGAGWVGRIVRPLLGALEEVEREAGAWHRELLDAPARSAEDRAAAVDLFLRFLVGRFPDRDVYALVGLKEDAVENTLTGRNLIAKGEARGLRLAILDVLDARGLTAPHEVRERLEREVDLARLAEILRAALHVGPDLAGLFPA